MTISEIFSTIRDWAVGKFQPKGSYAEITDIPAKLSELQNDVGYISTVPEEYITEEELAVKGYLTEETDPTVPEWAKQSTKPTYSKAEVGLGNVNNTSDIGKPVSTAQQAAIDAAYQQSTGYTDQKIAGLINGAPSTLDTLGEIAAAMQDNQDVVTALEQSIGTKADEADLNGHISNNVIHTSASEKTAWNNKMEKTGDSSNTIAAFTQATTRANIASGEKLSVIMGKIMKFFADLKTVAFSGKYSDLTDTPSIPDASTTTPKANGTAAAGTESAFARGDHVHPAQTTVSGNAGSATKWKNKRNIQTNLAKNGVAAVDGSANVDLGVTGILPVIHGGTGGSTETDARKSLHINPFVIVGKITGDHSETGYYKAFSTTTANWITQSIIMFIQPTNCINYYFCPFMVSLELRSSGTGKYEPVITPMSIISGSQLKMDYTTELLENLIICQDNSAPNGDIEIWYHKSVDVFRSLRITILANAVRGKDSTDDGLSLIKLAEDPNTAQTAPTSTLPDQYTFASVTQSQLVTSAHPGLVPALEAGVQAKYLCGDGTWQNLPDSIYQEHDPYSDGTPYINASTDWNTLTLNGTYLAHIGSSIPDGVNGPTGEYGEGELFVFGNGHNREDGKTRIVQIYAPDINQKLGALWIRTMNEGTCWHVWYKIPWIDENGYVNLRGQRLNLTGPNGNTKGCILLEDDVQHGANMEIGAGGNVFLGSGESYITVRPKLFDANLVWDNGKPAGSKGSEVMYVCADSYVYLLSNCNAINTTEHSPVYGVFLSPSGNFVPMANQKQMCGSNDHKWSKVCANEITMGNGSTDNSRIVWDADGILRFFGANKARIGTDGVYCDVYEYTEESLTMTCTALDSNKPIAIGKVSSNVYLVIYQADPNDKTLRILNSLPNLRVEIDDYLNIKAAEVRIYKDGYPSPMRFGMVSSDGSFIDSGNEKFTIFLKGNGGLYARYSSSSLAPMYASSFNTSSSIRYKENIRDMTEEEALKLLEYRVVDCDYKEEFGGAKEQQALLAEEVYEIDPFPVTLDEEGRPNALDYSKFVPKLIKMVQIQQRQIDSLKEEIERMKGK